MHIHPGYPKCSIKEKLKTVKTLGHMLWIIKFINMSRICKKAHACIVIIIVTQINVIAEKVLSQVRII
jgi:hypothetical protein